MVSYCDRWMTLASGVWRRRPSSTIASKDISSLTTGLIVPNLAGMILIFPSSINVQIVPVRCIYRSHRLKVDFQDENFENFLV